MNGTLFWAYALLELLELRESELRCYYYRERKRSTLVIAAIVPD